MSYFFSYYPEIPKEKVFHTFDLYHIIAMLIIILLIAAALFATKKAKPKTVNTTLRICAVLVPITELSRVIWMISRGQTSLSELLPLHVCGMQVFFIPAAIYSNKLILKDYVYTTALLGGILAIISPSGVAEAYPILHFQTIQTFVLHFLLIFIPLAMVICTDYKPTIKRFPGVLAIFLFSAGIALAADYLLDENYMFLRYPPEVGFLLNLFNHYGQFIYLLVAFLLLVGAGAIILGFSDLIKRIQKG